LVGAALAFTSPPSPLSKREGGLASNISSNQLILK